VVAVGYADDVTCVARRVAASTGGSVVVSARDLDSDVSLVVAAQDGDGDAFSELFRRHYASVRRTCARRLGDLREADEIAQAAFVRAWERIDRCGGERRFGGWVQVIAHNLCIDAMRDRSRTTPTESPAETFVAHDAPEDALLRAEAASLVQLALADLPPRQRDVVVARHIEERRPGEIAAALGLSVGAVDSLLLRGRRRLAATVERLSTETGVTSVPTASSVAGGVVGSSNRFTQLAQSIGNSFNRATYHVAASLGMVPGVSGPVHRLAAAALVTTAVAAGSAAGTAPAPSHSQLPLAVPQVTASPIPSTAVVDAGAPLSTVAARLHTSAPIKAPVVAVPLPSTPALKAPALAPVLAPVTKLLKTLGDELTTLLQR
jgi:RNA polymerase sigma-70 factor, ECF subfamily